jgi:DNA segregation ATPase FtsK/SpoIIIE-like protein
MVISTGVALPELLKEAFLIGSNRAERILAQLERDGIVTEKDENGKRKIKN